MNKMVAKKMAESIQAVHERCNSVAYEVHAHIVGTKAIKGPQDVDQLVSMYTSIVSGEAMWDTKEGVEAMTDLQREVLEMVVSQVENAWEICATIAHLCGYLVAGYGTLHMIRIGKNQAPGVWMDIPMS